MVTEYIVDHSDFFEQVFNHAPIGVMLVSEKGNILNSNPKCIKILGCEKEDVLTKTVQKLVFPQDYQEGQAFLESLFSSEDSLIHIEHHLYRNNGKKIKVSIQASLIKTSESTLLPLIYLQEIEDRSQIEARCDHNALMIDQPQKAALHYREHLCQLISENSKDIIYCLSQDSIIEYVSPAIKKILGYEPEELIGKHSRCFWHADDRSNYHNDRVNHQDEYIMEYRIQHKNGYYIWLETIERLVRNKEGEIIQKVGIDRDVTERKENEYKLYQSKERLESLIQNNADAIWVIDLNDHVLDINPAFENMFGWSETEILGKELPIIPNHLIEENKAIHIQVKGGKAVASKETIRVHKNGKLIYTSVTLSPIYNDDGQVIGINGICRNITHRKKIAAALRAKTQQLESFIENNVDAIVIFDKYGKVLKVNYAFERIFNWKSSEIEGKRLFELSHIPNDYKEEVAEFKRKVNAGESIIGHNTIRLKKDGQPINVLLSVSPIIRENGESNGWSVTLRDVTEWRKSQEMLRNAEKLSIAGQLAAGVAHEIRNPMTAIKGFIQLISQVGVQDHYLKVIASEIDRIDRILGELLLLAKPQVTVFKRESVHSLIFQTMTLLQTQAIMYNIEIITDFSSSDLYIQCDESQIKQVFINMIKNAIEAMPHGGKILIQTNATNSEVSIRFIDKGVGIPKKVLDQLGQPFYTTKENGTGLGFMVSKKIIENHSGTITIKSEINKGTTIDVTLPLD